MSPINVQISESDCLEPAGLISSIVDNMVVIQAHKTTKPLDVRYGINILTAKFWQLVLRACANALCLFKVTRECTLFLLSLRESETGSTFCLLGRI